MVTQSRKSSNEFTDRCLLDRLRECSTIPILRLGPCGGTISVTRRSHLSLRSCAYSALEVKHSRLKLLR